MNKLIISLLKGKLNNKITLLNHNFPEKKLLTICNNDELKNYNLEKGYGFSKYCEILDSVKRVGIKCISITDSEYPSGLKEIYDPPFMIYVRGSVEALNSRLVSIVGTRKPSSRGFHEAFRLGLDFGRAQIGVVSGLALGIDGASHRGNVCTGGKTVAVLGSGVDSIYPLSNKPLAGEILKNGGAIISEFIPDEIPRSFHFPKRNRIIAGLSRDLIIVQAPKKSGALITGDFTLQGGGDVYIHTVGIGDRRFLGSDKYYRDGAQKIDSAFPILQKYNRCEEFRIFDSESYKAEDLIRLELDGDIIKYKGCYFSL